MTKLPTALFISTISILLTIAEMKQQLIHCNPDLLTAPVYYTVTAISIKWYLLERILKIKGSHSAESKHIQKLNK
ncbi:MAG: hypothetical protein IJT73_01090 [Selenomonadaceae bacterium]|nr:hypothetical protein [Selenomonadaceae bacterium]